MISVFLSIFHMLTRPSTDLNHDIDNKVDQTRTLYSSIEPCSHQIFQHLYRDSGQFPFTGTWDKQGFYYPDNCRLLARPLEAGDICISKLGLTSIVTIGDSNGKRYFDALVDLINLAYDSCTLVRVENLVENGFVPEKEYFANGDQDLLAAMKTSRRQCRSCSSRKYVCRRDGHKIQLEHISMALLLDISLTVSSCHPGRSETFQEFVFKTYLTHLQPDMVLIFPPFNHMKHIGFLAEHKLAIKYVMDLIKEYQSDTSIFWFPCTGEVEHKKPAKWQNVTQQGLDSSQRIELLNGQLFHYLKGTILQPSANQFGFFDLQGISRNKPDLNEDGIHMVPSWYQRVMQYFIQVYCNSV